jgi:hypothetical protein
MTGFTCFGNIEVGCNKCKSTILVPGESLKSEVVESHKRNASEEIHHLTEWSGICDKCHSTIGFEMSAYEYPSDVIDRIEVIRRGCTLENSPNMISGKSWAPLLDIEGKYEPGTFTIFANGMAEVRCSKCGRLHDLDCKKLAYIYLEGEDVVEQSAEIIHIAEWNKLCPCGSKMALSHAVRSNVYGLTMDSKFLGEMCTISSEPVFLAYWYFEEEGGRITSTMKIDAPYPYQD